VHQGSIPSALRPLNFMTVQILKDLVKDGIQSVARAAR
jgi:hypothetical protein